MDEEDWDCLWERPCSDSVFVSDLTLMVLGKRELMLSVFDYKRAEKSIPGLDEPVRPEEIGYNQT